MSRHRNVRTMDYSEEYDGFDDVYGHSVEEDGCISPSDAEFMFDRTKQHQMSAFFNEEDDIAEEDESNPEGSKQGCPLRDSDNYQQAGLSEMDETRLRSCLDEIRNVVGDSVPEHVLIEAILKNQFNLTKALDVVLNSVTSAADPPKPQREKRTRDRDFDSFVSVEPCSEIQSLREKVEALGIKDAESSTKLGSVENYTRQDGNKKLNIPRLKMKVRNDSEKENLLDEDIDALGVELNLQHCSVTDDDVSDKVPQLSSLSDLAKKHSYDGNGSFSSLAQLACTHSSKSLTSQSSQVLPMAELTNKHSSKPTESHFLEDGNVFSSLAQLAKKHSLTPLESKSSEAVSLFSMAQLSHKHSSESLASKSSSESSLTSTFLQLANKHPPNPLDSQSSQLLNSPSQSWSHLTKEHSSDPLEFQLLEECGHSLSLSHIGKEYLSEPLKSPPPGKCGPFSSLTQLADKVSLYPLETHSPQHSLCSSLSRLKIHHVQSAEESSHFSSLAQLANKHSAKTQMSDEIEADSVSSLTDLASRHLKKYKEVNTRNGKLTKSSKELLKTENLHTADDVYDGGIRHSESTPTLCMQTVDTESQNILEDKTRNSYDDIPSDAVSAKRDDEDEVNWVIDLTSALTSPSHRVSRPNMKPESRDWNQEAVTDELVTNDNPQNSLDFETSVKILNCKLLICKKSSSPFGKIICKKWKQVFVPYANRRKQSLGKIVHFSFNTPSPDDSILKHLRRK